MVHFLIYTRTILSVFICLTLTFSCKSPNQSPSADKKEEELWLNLSIKANGSEFYLEAFTDSLYVRKLDTLNLQKSYKMSKSEKDSLFSWTEKLIDIKTSPSRFCTDYYGKLSLRIVYSEQMSKQINFNSICEWEKLDSNSRKICQLLSKIENAK